MKNSVVRALILSDWQRQQMLILGSIVAGGLAFGIMQFGGEIPTVVGSVLLFTGLIVLACMLPVTNVINERKKQTLPFLMSLPVSVTQLTTAKLVSTFGLFLIPWTTLVIAGSSLIISRTDIPNGVFPIFLALSGLTLLGFALIAGTALVIESEGATIVSTIFTNSTYGLFWYLMVRNKGIRDNIKSPTVVWGNEILTVLGIEFAIIVAILAITFYMQSRKRDFV